jgi:hypothetical protein
MRLSTVQDLIETSWAARGISIPLVPGHASWDLVLQTAAKSEGSV